VTGNYMISTGDGNEFVVDPDTNVITATTPNACSVDGGISEGYHEPIQDTTVYMAGKPLNVLSCSAITNITAIGGITVTADVMRIQGDGGAIEITANPQIAAPYQDGTVVELEGMSDVNTVQLDDGTGLQLAGAVSFVMGEGDTIKLRWNLVRTVWVELSRSEN